MVDWIKGAVLAVVLFVFDYMFFDIHVSRDFVGLIYWEGQRKQYADQSTQSGLRWEGHVCHFWGK